MTKRPVRWGFDGFGRMLSYGDAPKVARAEITSAYDVDVRQLTLNEDVYDNEDKRSFMKRPGTDGFNLLEGEMAFKVRGGGNRVMTALNGLDASLVEVYPNDRALVRDILESLIQPIGVVREDARSTQDKPQVTLRIGGSCPAGSPGYYNVDGQEKAHITAGCAVVFGVPNLQDPILFGNKASGLPENKVLLVARAADKRAVARRIQNILGRLTHDPARFQRAMKDHSRVGNAWLKIGMRVIHSYKVATLMAIDLLLKQQVLQVHPRATELLASDGSAMSSEDTVARMAELLGVIESKRLYGTLNVPQRTKWKELEMNLKQRMIPVPNPDTQAYNAANEFAFTRDPANKTWTSKARVGQTGELRRDALGKLLEQSLTHLPHLLEAFTEANWDERRLTMGIALTTPTQAGTGIFDMFLQPKGGLSDIN